MKQGVLLKLQMMPDGISISVQEKEDMVEMENIVNNTQSGIHPEINTKRGWYDEFWFFSVYNIRYLHSNRNWGFTI